MGVRGKREGGSGGEGERGVVGEEKSGKGGRSLEGKAWGRRKNFGSTS